MKAKKLSSKLLALVLAVSMTLGTSTTSVFAAEEETIADSLQSTAEVSFSASEEDSAEEGAELSEETEASEDASVIEAGELSEDATEVTDNEEEASEEVSQAPASETTEEIVTPAEETATEETEKEDVADTEEAASEEASEEGAAEEASAEDSLEPEVVEEVVEEDTALLTAEQNSFSLDRHELRMTARAGVSESITATFKGGGEIKWTLDYEGKSKKKKAPITTESSGPITGGSSTLKITPDPSISEYTFVTITASADGGKYSDTCELRIYPWEKCADPKCSLESKYDSKTKEYVVTVNKGDTVAFTTATVGADIVLSPISVVKGTAPANSSEMAEIYTRPIAIEDEKKIYVQARKDGLNSSNEICYSFKFAKNVWGDLDNNPQLKSKFKTVADVPAGVWYAIDGNRVDDWDVEEGHNGESVKKAKLVPPSLFSDSYTGSALTFNDRISVFHSTRQLVEGRDYTVSFGNNVNAAAFNSTKAPYVSIKGKGSYKNTMVFKYTIEKANLEGAVLESERYVGVKEGTVLSTIKPVVSFKGKTLTLGKDYVVTYSQSTSPGVLGSGGRTEITDPGKTKAEGGAVYYINIKACDKASCNFTGEFYREPEPKPEKQKDGTIATPIYDVNSYQTDVEIRVASKSDKQVKTVSGLKLVDRSGKAPKFNYGEKIDTENPETLFTGSNPRLSVYDGKKKLAYGEDYYAYFADGTDHKSAGKHKIIVCGTTRQYSETKDPNSFEPETYYNVGYVGNKNFTYEIVGMPMSKVKVEAMKTSVMYTGYSIDLYDLYDPTVKNRDLVTLTMPGYGVLRQDYDYTVSMPNYGKVGKVTVEFVGKGAFSGTLKKTVNITPYDITEKGVADGHHKVSVLVYSDDTSYTKTGAKPTVEVMFGGSTLKEGVDYTVTYKNNTKPVDGYDVLEKLKDSQKPYAIVKGIGNFKGSVMSDYFAIFRADPEKAIKLAPSDVVDDENGNYYRGHYKSALKFYDNGVLLKVGKNKDIESVSNYSYYYAADTKLKTGEMRYAGAEVQEGDKIPVNTVIKVLATVNFGANSGYGKRFIQNMSGAYFDSYTLEGYYSIISKGRSISNAVVTVVGPISFNNANEVVLTEKNLKVVIKNKDKKGRVIEEITLREGEYVIESITNNKFLGTATVTIRGKSRQDGNLGYDGSSNPLKTPNLRSFGGTKTFKFKINAKSMN